MLKSPTPDDIKKVQTRMKHAAQKMSRHPSDATVKAAIKKLENDIKHRPIRKATSIASRISKYFYHPGYAAFMLGSVVLANYLAHAAVSLRTPRYNNDTGELLPNDMFTKVLKTTRAGAYHTFRLLLSGVLAMQSVRLMLALKKHTE